MKTRTLVHFDFKFVERSHISSILTDFELLVRNLGCRLAIYFPNLVSIFSACRVISESYSSFSISLQVNFKTSYNRNSAPPDLSVHRIILVLMIIIFVICESQFLLWIPKKNSDFFIIASTFFLTHISTFLKGVQCRDSQEGRVWLNLFYPYNICNCNYP